MQVLKSKQNLVRKEKEHSKVGEHLWIYEEQRLTTHSVNNGEQKSRLERKTGAKLWKALNPTPKKIGFHTTGNSQPLNDSDIVLI